MTKPDLIAEAITEAFGERCTEFASGCFCCEAWREYDELRTKPDEHGWRPIETAPKDGTEILVGKQGWVPSVAFWNKRTGSWDDGDFYSHMDWPTHWHPLPGPIQPPVTP